MCTRVGVYDTEVFMIGRVAERGVWKCPYGSCERRRGRPSINTLEIMRSMTAVWHRHDGIEQNRKKSFEADDHGDMRRPRRLSR